MKYSVIILAALLLNCKPQSENVKYETTYHENGMVLTTSTLVNGKPDGKALIFDNKGRKVREQNYVNGVLDGVQFQFQNGVLFAEESFTNGNLNGWAKYYNVECGIPIKEGKYLNGKRDGLWIEYIGREVREISYFENDSLLKKEFANPKFNIVDGQPPLDPSLDIDCCCKQNH